MDKTFFAMSCGWLVLFGLFAAGLVKADMQLVQATLCLYVSLFYVDKAFKR